MIQEDILNRIHTAVFVLKNEKSGVPSNIIYVNEYMCSVLGYTSEKILSLQFPNISDPIVLIMNKKIFRNLKLNEEYILEDNLLPKNGHRFTLSSTRTLMFITRRMC